MNIVGKKNYKNTNFAVFIVNEPNVSNFKDYPEINKNTEIKILTNATQKANTDPINITLSLNDIPPNFYLSNLLSTCFEPIVRAAEYVALQI